MLSSKIPAVRFCSGPVALLLAGTAFPAIATAQVLPTSDSVIQQGQVPSTTSTAPGTQPAATQPADQPVGTAATPAPDSGDIIVTGQRRAARLQQVPASVTAVSGETLASTGFRSPTDLQYVAPTLTFNPQQGAGFQIRGVGSQGFDYNLEKSVSTVLDDVVQGLPRSVGLNTLADIERVEILRGPQGTLFGKNASAGVVFVVTNKPKLGKTELIGRAQYGSGGEYYLENTVNVPIASNAAVRITGVYQHHDGIINNKYDNSEIADYTDKQVRAKLLWEPLDGLSAYFIADFQEHDDTGAGLLETLRTYGTYTGVITTLNFPALLGQYGVVAGPDNRDVVNNQPTFTRARNQNLTATFNYEIGSHTLTSVTGYKHQSITVDLETDNSQSNYYIINRNDLDANQFSQELRLSSPTGGFLDYVAGLYYYHNSIVATETQGGDFNRTDLPANTYISPTGGPATYDASSRSLAAFGQSNLHFTPKLTGVIGLRFTNDRVEGGYRPTTQTKYIFIPQTVIPAAKSATATKSDLSARVSLQYSPNRDLMVYATYSQGYKAPAIGTTRGNVLPVREETVDNYEAGIKTQFFDRRVTFNLSAYYAKFKNFQTQTFVNNSDGSVSFVLANAGGLKSYGIESDFRIRATDRLTFSGGAAWSPTEYTDFATSCYPLQPRVAVPGPGCYVLPGTTTTVFQAKGLPSILAPKWSFNISANLVQPLGGDLELHVDPTYSWRSEVYSVVGNPNTIVNGYGLFNGTIGVGPRNGRWNVGVYFRNLFDDHYVSRIRATNFAAAGTYSQVPAVDARRTVGGSLSYHF